MLKDITLGQFFPGNSLLHRLDPRMKILICLAYIVGIFMCQSVSSYIFLILVTVLLMIISRLPIKTVLKGLEPVVLVIFITALLNLLWRGGETLVLSFWIINIYLEGIVSSIFMMIRIIILMMMR